MRFNVPRLGFDGGFVHVHTGRFLCDMLDDTQKVLDDTQKGLPQLPDAEVPKPGQATIFGRLFRWYWQRDGFWITDANGYKNRMPLALVRTDHDGMTCRRIIIGRFLLEWGEIPRVQEAEPTDEEPKIGWCVAKDPVVIVDKDRVVKGQIV